MKKNVIMYKHKMACTEIEITFTQSTYRNITKVSAMFQFNEMFIEREKLIQEKNSTEIKYKT